MAPTTNGTRRPAARDPLRREAPSTVALLADAEDFTAMRRYTTFVFDDHRAYLRQAEGLLRSLSAQGTHATVALFDPEEYAEFCRAALLDPDAPASRTRYVADVASRGATVPYEGQPVDRLVPLLLEEAERRGAFDRATALLARADTCPGCREDGAGRRAYVRASQALARLVEAAGPGSHHAVCSVPVESEPLLAVLHAERREEGIELAEAEALVFCTVLAAGIATGGPGGIVLRTTGAHERPGAGGTDGTGSGGGTGPAEVAGGAHRSAAPVAGAAEVRGWALRDGWPRPLTAAEVFSAYCTDADTGEPVPPEPGVEYRAGIDLGEPPGE